MASEKELLPLKKSEALSDLPPEWSDDALSTSIANKLRSSSTTIVVMDDDPTGTQTVYGIPVLTEWTESIIQQEFERKTPAFYIMTNSRSVTPDVAKKMNVDIIAVLQKQAKAYERKLSIISRSDSTLRGHYPLEIDVLSEEIMKDNNTNDDTSGTSCGDDNNDNNKRTKRVMDGHLVIPFFLEGGRYTINDVHYVAEGADALLPAAQTPFAQDHAFGFTQSNLKRYVEEKSKGKIKSENVVSISIDDLRRGGPTKVREKLLTVTDGAACVVNAASLRDLEVLVSGLIDSEEKDHKNFLVRSAASYVQARLGLRKRPVLDADLINHTNTNRGGLIVVGSYVPKTSRQLESVLKLGKDKIEPIELNVSLLIAEDTTTEQKKELLAETSQKIETVLASGNKKNVVVYTSRKLITGSTPSESLRIGNIVSESLVSIVSNLSVVPPKFIIAKGGITSSDVATRGLGIKRAVILGQAAPGIPVWKIGLDNGKFPGMSYVVFPGNVGAEDELAKLISRLSS